MSPSDQNSFDTDLDWQAFLYVSGEMSADESQAFEMRLADDQAAREAVAAAVEIATAVSNASAVCVAAAPVPDRRRRNLAAVAAALAVCASCAFWLARSADERQRVDGAGLPDLLALWIDPETDWRDDDEDGTVAADDDADELAVPDWMLAAVGGTEIPAEENQ